jgi:hypothetical protein
MRVFFSAMAISCLLIAGLSGCGSGGGPSSPAYVGRWRQTGIGSLDNIGEIYLKPCPATIVDNGGGEQYCTGLERFDFRSDGKFFGSDEDGPLNGTYQTNGNRLVLYVEGFPPMNLRFTVNAGAMVIGFTDPDSGGTVENTFVRE